MVDSFKLTPTLKDDYGQEILSQALKRVQSEELMLETTIGSDAAINRLWKAMADDNQNMLSDERVFTDTAYVLNHT